MSSEIRNLNWSSSPSLSERGVEGVECDKSFIHACPDSVWSWMRELNAAAASQFDEFIKQYKSRILQLSSLSM